jgi:hypothetical protein
MSYLVGKYYFKVSNLFLTAQQMEKRQRLCPDLNFSQAEAQ